ncbi:MAG TPA: hypothetical protein VNA04_08895 [Thermoanaerobaculia bacterium]|nr:hypothetical protein [Thermoanaerobaculia bacterium]
MKRTLVLMMIATVSLFGFACAREEHTNIGTEGESAIVTDTSVTMSTTDTSYTTDTAVATDTAMGTDTTMTSTTGTTGTELTEPPLTPNP